ncbi:MAG: sigma-54-dependent Fis family transcriptional regulator [Bacteroidales bacterium]|nr:sigma-54-dependent Fis family transcriptional regulator [Bacteroidales bacterium]MCB9000149.1 sigma-54-dependent Fis family transcriptional regulator [Bacteroidales bacterium]MCB9013506.1 sigma-54-dependent Fis family transcriptional regulator [Bacteroidales bacterium]
MSQKSGKILVVDDNEDILFAVKLLLKSSLEKIETINNPEKIPEMMAGENWDVILLDMNFTKDAISGQEGFRWLRQILNIDPNAIVVFITAYGDAEKAVRAIKEGATDFVLKPWQNEKMLATINSALKLRQSKLEAEGLRQKQREISAVLDQPFTDFIGKSPEMNQVFNTIKKVAATDANILILGENGTGKELVARALYRNSLRKDEVFINVDLGSIAETLFESELFGHEKGAFTDARQMKQGRFEIASGGTLFLDEIGNLSSQMQTKLLTIIERREVTRVGSNKPLPVDVRLICATNNNIHQDVEEGKFRQDLLYRINTVEIHLPPLRERTGDLLLLSEHFLKIYSRKYKKNIKGILSSSLKKLQAYHWPGNVRELQHAIERAVIMSDGDMLTPDDFNLTGTAKKTEELEINTHNLDEIEKSIIQKVLKQYQGNISQAAQDLGLTRTSLYRRMEKHGL